MGYTHYFPHEETTQEAWKKIINDCKTLKDNLDGIRIAGWDGTGQPKFNKSEIAFNGAEPLNYETFEIRRLGAPRKDYMDPAEKPFTFCKTARMPYDLMVCACLLVYKYHSPNTMDLSSDGSDIEWREAEEFVLDMLGYDLSYSKFKRMQ